MYLAQKFKKFKKQSTLSEVDSPAMLEKTTRYVPRILIGL